MKKRPEILQSKIYKTRCPFGDVYLTVSFKEERPIEIFITVGKSGQSLHAKMEAIGRLVSLALRYNVPVEEVVAQLEGIQGDSAFFHNGDKILSLPDFISYILRKEIKNEEENRKVDKKTESGKPKKLE